MSQNRFLGITVFPEYIQTEGIEGVLANLKRMGATAVTTSPYVMEQVDADTGHREPPDDAGAGHVRLLDRPLWGERSLFVRTAPAFIPDTNLYKGLRYQPPPTTPLTSSQGPLMQDFVVAARAQGLQVFLQVQAAIPPGYRVQFGGPTEDDQPRLPDGRIPPKRLANNGSLASPHIVAYLQALLRDLCQAYPEVDGFRLDWPEYPPYFLDDVFLDFGIHAYDAAQRLGLDWEGMQVGADKLYQLLHGGLTDDHLTRWLTPAIERYILAATCRDQPWLGDWLRLKAFLVDELLTGARLALRAAGAEAKQLMPHAFPPPFSLVSGMNYSFVAPTCTAFCVKLYTMHWPVMLRSYGDVLLQNNPGLSESLLVRTLVQWFDIADDQGLPRLADYHYPGPEEAHPVGPVAQARKLAMAQREAGDVPVYALAHGYGPADDFRNRLRVAWEGSRGVWINRYGYLSDEKLDIIHQVCSSA